MVTYIYFVKCPNCEDEHFDFFDEAKEFALGCLSQKPIITQTEVCRNDFGECTDSADLGTVWSWEEAMKDTEGGYTDAEPTISIFTKDDLKLMTDGKDPEFDELDNSVDVEITENLEHIQYCPSCGAMNEYSDSQDNGSWVRYTCRACDNTWDIDKPRKPIPEGMTIEQLVEEMEENEDTVECVGCEELFPKDECVHKEDIGWLCSRCEMGIKSRGELLTFREGNWDDLDESVSLEEAYDFKYLSLVDDAKAQIVAELKKDPIASRFIKNDTINVGLSISVPKNVRASGYLTKGTVTDFIIAEGRIELSYDIEGTVRFVDLEAAMKGTNPYFGKPARTMPTYAVLNALKEAAEDLNRASTNVTGLRDHRAVAELTPKIAEELRDHIREIHFTITAHSSYDVFDLENAEPHPKETFFDSNPSLEAIDSKLTEVAEHLNRIHDNFMALPFANDAVAAGMVSYREPINDDNQLVDTLANFTAKWGIACTIYFDSGWKVKNFTQDTQDYLQSMKYNKKGDPNKLTLTANFVEGIRAAKALIRHFGNDIRFFDKKVSEGVSLSDIASAANHEFGTGYGEEDFLIGLDDEGFFDDLETPEAVSKELYAKRGMNAFGPRKSKLGEATELHDLGNEYDGGYPTEKPELPEFDEDSDSHLRLCPECGKETFDIETGICVDCGFN